MSLRTGLMGKRALITGASRGIGAAICESLWQQGATVLGTATTKAGVEMINEVMLAQGINGHGVLLNVNSVKAVDEAIDGIRKKYGPPQILINNAGIVRDKLLVQMSEEDWDSVIETDLKGVFSLSRACLPSMIKERWGRIINIGSVVSAIGNAGQTNYAAAKSGVIGFTHALAYEVGRRNITVNTVAPGFIETDMTATMSPKVRDALNEKVALKRFGDCYDIAAMVTFLCSEMGSYITGQTVHINGGLHFT